MNCKKGLRLLVDHRETDSGENRRLKLKKITLDVLSLVLACLGLVKAVLAIKHQLDDANTLDLVIASLSIVDFIGRQNLLAIGLIRGKEAPAGSLRADWEIMSMYGTIGAISVLLGLLKAVTAQIDDTRASNIIDIANASISISRPCLLLYHRFRSEFKFDPYWRQHLSTSFLIIVTAVLLFFWSILKDYQEPFFIWNLGNIVTWEIPSLSR